MWIQGEKGSLKDAWGGGNILLDDGTRMTTQELFDRDGEKELMEKWFPSGITDSFALKLFEVIMAIVENRKPEIDGSHGLQNVAASYAIIESSWFNKVVTIEEILSGKLEGWQKGLNEHYGL